MKPLNLDNRPCSPISSNCVIWQGPDIPCIKLCTGDTVSDVIASLATELCTIMDQLKVSNYDLSCLNLTACPPEDFQALIQLLINKICELNGIPVDDGKSSGCPDCVVSVAPCFVEGNQTTMQLIDYVQMIANKICDILDQIDVINNQITNLDDRVTVLENTPPPTFTLPSINTNCLAPYMPIPGTVSAPIDQVLNTLLSNSTNGYCSLIEATGLPADLASAVTSQCINSTDLSLKSESEGDSPVQTMAQEYFGSWVNTPTTVGDAITNLWISLCDLRTYVESLDFQITVEDTTTITLDYSSNILSASIQDTGWHDIAGFNHYSTASDMVIKKPQARRIGNVIYFKGEITVPLNNSGTALTYYYKSGTNTYEGTVGDVPAGIPPCLIKAPYTGPGGMTLLSGGSVAFNNNTNVIPAAVLPPGYAVDGTYTTTWQVAWRPMDTGTCNTVLTSMFRPAITATGALVLALFADTEESFVSGCSDARGTSHLNYIISHVTAGQNVTDFKSTLNVYDSTSTGNQNAQPFFETGETYPISIDANDQDEIGGFSCRIDGLMGFISPCATPAIPTPNPCIPA